MGGFVKTLGNYSKKSKSLNILVNLQYHCLYLFVHTIIQLLKTIKRVH